MAQYTFGSGVLVGTPLTDAFGAAISNPTPIQFGVLQNVSIDLSFDVKQLFGQFQFPVAIGRGKGSITGKATFAQISGIMLNALFFGQTMTSGTLAEVIDTTGTAIPATPFQITPTVPGGGTWSVDLGVIDANGVPMTRVASAPTAGQYSVSAGVYTFASANVGQVVRISYQYTATSTTARRQTVSNVLMGQQPTFRADLLMPFNGRQWVLTLPQCTSTKLSLGTKLDDFMLPDFDFSSFADASGNVAFWGTTE